MDRAQLSYPWIEIGLGLRNQVNDMFDDARRMGCTVTYWRERGLISTVYRDVKIEGPEHVVRRIHRAFSNMT